MAPITSEQDKARTLELLRALADETRFRILSLIAASEVALSAQQVAESLELHPNTIRPHLERLRDAGFLDLVVASDGRVGRPQHLYRLAPDAPRFGVEMESRDEAASIMVETLTLLAETIEASEDQAADLGRAWGRRLEEDAESDRGATVVPTHDQAASAIQEESARLGFKPTRVGGEVYFNACPFRPVVERYPEIACAAHRGICEGIVGTLGHDDAAPEFHRRGPEEPCSVAVSSTLGDSNHDCTH